MKTVEELKKYYEEQLLSDLKELDGKRKKTLLTMIGYTGVVFVVGVVLAVVLILMAYTTNPCLPCCVIMAPMFLLIAWIVSLNHAKSGYVKGFKVQVMPKIVKFIDEGLSFDEKRGVSLADFGKSKIFLTHVDSYSSEDYIYGTVGKTKIEFSEVHAQEKREYRDSKGHRHTQYVTIFKGVFFIADFNKNFRTQTLVLPDTAEKLLGNMIGSFLQSKNIGRPPLVKMEDPEFEKIFVVYGDDQIEARYVLSTSLMRRIVDFKNRTKRNVYLSFIENKLMVAIPEGRNLFEPRLFRSIVDYSQVEQYYNDLKFIVEIIDDLNLNTRIWGKE
ncbi:MAG: DUF3137 domain-containing protein [Candidatus Altiarchaeota archaeon]|nr:DUF3137 domain-containing protein [Candidatus Altiarchaeota archaeon]